jgi:membrane protease YdiL (CAAX protease family)
MSVATVAVRRENPHRAQVGVLLLAFVGACTVRVALAGASGAAAVAPGLVFAALLAAATIAVRTPARWRLRTLVVGVAAAVVLVAPALAHLHFALARTHPAMTGYPAWAAVTAVVAGAEEAFLRGALYDAVLRIANSDIAIAVAAIAFALMHVPFYGWHAVPVDLAVGIVLGLTRHLAGSWTAPAIAHVSADMAGWWLV